MTPSPSMNPERADAILRMLTDTVADDADAQRADSRRTRTRGLVIASMAFVVIVVVGGVGYALTQNSSSTSPGPGGIAAPTSTPSSSVAPSPTGTSGVVDPAGTATPVPTPTPTATANDPMDVDSWVITTDGMGPLVPGLTMDAADQLVSGAGLAISTCGEGVGVAPTRFYSIEDGPQFAVIYGADSRVQAIALVGSIMGAAHRGGPVTPHDIGLGSTTAQLKAAYPALETVPPGNAGEEAYALSDGAGHWIDFVVDDSLGSVQEILVSADKTVPSEFCA